MVNRSRRDVLFSSCKSWMQAGVETCLILGELGMGTDALVSAILSGVLRPDVQPSEFGRAAVTVEDIEEVRYLLSG